MKNADTITIRAVRAIRGWVKVVEAAEVFTYRLVVAGYFIWHLIHSGK